MKRALLIAAASLAVLGGGVVAAGAYFHVPEIAAIFTSGAAKMLCTDVFVAGRDPELAYEQDFARVRPPGKYLQLARTRVDREHRRVTASLFGVAHGAAIYREGVGCTAVQGVSEAQLRAQGEGVASALPPPDPNALWPEGEAALDEAPGVDSARLAGALDRAFSEPEPDRPRRTRAVVVVHRGRIIAERYAAGFDRDTAHLSNSMAKSVTSALIGILVGQGRLDVNAPAPVSEWRAAGDPRGAITLDNLLRMSSGLQFEEDYTKVWSDITRQFIGGDMARYAAAKPLEHPPGAVWHYSTGTSHILGRIVRETAGPDLRAAFAFPRRALFDPIGARTAVLEVDGAGNFVGGSFFHASARDYARLGLLYLNDGVWNGRRILPEGWVAYTRTPTPNTPADVGYGAHFWLNRKPDLPADAYYMSGHQGQSVTIIPSREAVIVRVGLSEFPNWKASDLVKDVLVALPPPGAEPHS
jgi:CubicO group peptidase (beta-lactamase class C family)